MEGVALLFDALFADTAKLEIPIFDFGCPIHDA